MTPRTAIKPLTVTPGNGTSPVSTRELVQTQNALLQSNASVLGAVNQFREDVTDRRVEAALVAERAEAAATAAKIAADAELRHAAKAAEERHDQTAKIEAHALAWRWRVGIALAATTGLGALMLNLFNVFVIGK